LLDLQSHAFVARRIILSVDATSAVKDSFKTNMAEEGLRWKCVDCDSIMDKTNFTDFIKQSDNDKNSNEQAKSAISYLATSTRQD
jgi:uncharacterized protein YfcZ (UPF0381/DUF406 family)